MKNPIKLFKEWLNERNVSNIIEKAKANNPNPRMFKV